MTLPQPVLRWLAQHRPEHLRKQRLIRRYAKGYNLQTFIETGTYKGDMVNAMRNVFYSLVSIELDHGLALEARRRFTYNRNVLILEGDSAIRLSDAMTYAPMPALFWLDGHYSGGVTATGATHTPVMAELAQILENPPYGSVILIDDAHNFDGQGDYPSVHDIVHALQGVIFSLDVSEGVIQIVLAGPR
jgi:hypothetical protein